MMSSENSYTKVFDPSADFDAWCEKLEQLLETRNKMSKKDVRCGLVKLFKEYWILESKMQELVVRVNDLLERGTAAMDIVGKFQLRREQNGRK